MYGEDGPARDNKDPNYSSEDEVLCVAKVVVIFGLTLVLPLQDYVISPSSPQLTPEQFRKEAEVIFRVSYLVVCVGGLCMMHISPLQEYFDHGDTAEVKVRLATWSG